MDTMVQRRRWVFAGVSAVVCVLCVWSAWAQEGESVFEHRARLLRVIDSNPERVVAALEQVLSAEQAVALESMLAVSPDDRDKAESLEAAKRRLLEAGIDESDVLLREIDARLSELMSEDEVIR